jgi:hypothetical protein
MRKFWVVCRASYIRGGICLCEPDFGVSFEVNRIALTAGHASCVAILARNSGERNVGYPTEASRLGLYNIAIVGSAKLLFRKP